MWNKNSKDAKTDIKPPSTGVISTIISEHAEIQGDIIFREGLHIDGLVKGNVIGEANSNASLVLSGSGVIEGEVRVPTQLINGTVNGNLYSSEHLELAVDAKVNGDVEYNVIEMTVGSTVNGKLTRSNSQTANYPEKKTNTQDDLKNKEKAST